MKKAMLIFAVLSITAAQSQEISIADALRYSQNNQNGTARFRAMGGAFGALGGDLSATTINPAGSAVFNASQLGITLNNTNSRNNSNYFGSDTEVTDNSFDFNQAGFVFVFNGKPEGWNKFSLSVNYDNLNNFNNSVYSAGVNPTQSIGNYFTNFANANGGIDESLLLLQPGETISSLYQYLGEAFGFGAQQAFLGYQAFVIDPASGSASGYVSTVPEGGNYYHENTVVSSGYNGKLTFNAATSYQDKLYFGLNLNSHFTDYAQFSSIYESNTNSPNAGVQRLRFSNDLRTFGNGFSFQLGAIAKITDFRVGLAYESPTWLTLTDRTMQSLRAVSADDAGDLPIDTVSPNVENLYVPYRIQTPSKWTGSLAYVFGQSGLLSVDYAIRDYSATQFKPQNEYSDLNTAMSNDLRMAGELRIGGEYIIKAFSLRGGYRMEQSPYENGRTIGDLTGYSAGIGYNFGSTRVDLAYAYTQRDFEQQFLTSGMTSAAAIDAINHNVSLSLLFQL